MIGNDVVDRESATRVAASETTPGATIGNDVVDRESATRVAASETTPGATIGNDVVDLRDPGTRASAIHPRFDERVMAASERSWLAARAEPERDRWLLWAAKEAAYKAARRMAPALVFAPARFVVELDDAREGVVTIGDERFDVTVNVLDDAVHAVASRAGSAKTAIVSACSRGSDADPSAAVRRLAVEMAAARSGRSLEVAMRGRVPALRGTDELTIPLSLSHHGEVVGFAVVLA